MIRLAAYNGRRRRRMETPQMKTHIRQLSDSTSEATIRQHKILIDRPTAKGGQDQGPMGGELFLAAIGGCFSSNLLAAIKVREADVSEVQVEVIASLADAPARFVAVEVSVSARYSDPQLFEKLVAIAEKGCIMMNTLRGKLDLTIRIATPV
jgi:putative redox protein